MPDGRGLLVDVALSTAKLERDMDRIVAKFTKGSDKIDSVWVNATRGIDNSFKKAAGSASVFEREIAKTDRQVEALRRSIDPLYAATRRLEQQEELLNRALRQGSISAKVHEASLSLVRSEYDLATGAAQRFAGSAQRVAGGFAGARGQIQNVAFQVGDFATQVGAGTSASQALGQQLPQLLGGFGALGAVLGAVAAIGVPLGAALFRAGTAADELEEDVVNLSAAVSDYVAASQNAFLPTEELAEKYGTATEAARRFAVALRDISEVNAGEALDRSITELVREAFGSNTPYASQFESLDALEARYLEVQRLINDPETGDVAAISLDRELIQIAQMNSQLTTLADNLGTSEEGAIKLSYAFAQLENAETVRDQVEAAEALRLALERVFGPYEDMKGAARAAYEETLRIGEAAAQVKGAMDAAALTVKDLAEYVSDVSSNLGLAIGQANGLAASLATAAQNAFAAAQALAAARAARAARGPDQAVQETRERLTPSGIRRDDIVFQRTFNTPRANRANSRGGSGSDRERDDIFASATAQVTALQRQIEMLGKTGDEVARLTARYRLLDAAKEAGINLDSKVAASGDTVRERIEAQAAAIGRLTAQAAEYAEVTNFAASIQNDLKDGFLDAIVAGEGLDGVLQNLASSLAKAALQAAIFGDGPFGGQSAGGGFLGVFARALSFDGGGYTGAGARTGGIDGRGGFPAILHPNETVVDHTRGQGLGGAVMINVNVEGANGDAAIEAAVNRGVASGIAVMNQRLPSRVAAINSDPRVR